MRAGGRISAAILILADVLERHRPVNMAVREWGKRSRYAGSKDRAWVSGLVMDALRRRASIGNHMGHDDPRALVLGTLRFVWNWPAEEIEQASYDEHGPTPLTNAELEALKREFVASAPLHVAGDFPDWMTPHVERVFGAGSLQEMQAMAVRADVGLRINTLKAEGAAVDEALSAAHAVRSPLLKAAYHIPARDPAERESSIETIPAYSKGWVEVQDVGSQIAAAAANAQPGEQVLDFCAGGGGKTLALAAQMQNKGQIYAYDIDAKRLSALSPRLKRSGAHNVQLVDPRGEDSLSGLLGEMDVVFVDAPCTGTGTWRRRPDSKWRLRPNQLSRRLDDQRLVLREAAKYVRSGGRILYATCSFLMEENEDRVSEFLQEYTDFTEEDAAEAAIASGQLTEQGEELVKRFRTAHGSVRLTPARSGTDGFFFSVLRKAI